MEAFPNRTAFNSRESNRLVFALDFGTTYTGFAHGIVEADQRSVDFNKIKSILDWPGPYTNVKVPSRIAHGAATGGQRQWGAEIDESSWVLAYLKLELEPQERVEELRSILSALEGMDNLNPDKLKESKRGIPKYPPKTATELVTSFLKEVRIYALEQLNADMDRLEEVRRTMPIDLVVTVPAEWTAGAKTRTLQAVTRAGFTKENFPSLRKTLLASEPEAAAEYTLRYASQEPAFDVRKRDSIILCDAGGGTVDLVAYQITQIKPEFTMDKIGVGTSDRCGASYIDRRFRDWLFKKLGPKQAAELDPRAQGNAGSSYNVMSDSLRKVMEKFETFKRAFGGPEAQEFNFISFDQEIEDDPDNGIQDNDLRITQEDMEYFFRDCLEKICDLLSGQITQVELAGSAVRSIFLTGGFAESDYLLKEVSDFAQVRRIEVHRGPSPQEAVLKGAVTKGMGFGTGQMATVTACPQNFGVVVSETYEGWRHEDKNTFDNQDGVKKVANRVTWLLEKDEPFFSNERTSKGVSILRKVSANNFTGSVTFHETLVACHEKVLHDTLDKIPKHMYKSYTLDYTFTSKDLPHFTKQKGKVDNVPYLTVLVRLQLEYDPVQQKVVAAVMFQGESIASCTMDLLPEDDD